MSDVFEAPKTDSTTDLDEVLITGPSWKILVPSGLLLVGGATTATAGFQLAVFVNFYSVIAQFIPWLLFGSGISLVVLSAIMSRGRVWAAWASVVLIALTTVLALGWNIYLILGGIVTPVNWLMLLIDGLCMVVVPFAIPEAARLTRVRKQLYGAVE